MFILVFYENFFFFVFFLIKINIKFMRKKSLMLIIRLNNMFYFWYKREVMVVIVFIIFIVFKVFLVM